MLRLPQSVFETAVHEAGHAVQAFLTGMGIHRLSIDPPLIRTKEQHQLEAAGYNLLTPVKREDRLVDFYRRDIQVRVAGPLASLRLQHETLEQSLKSVVPAETELWLWGGASSETSMGDEDVALHEATILSRWHPLKPEPYVRWVKGVVWHETILDSRRWTAVIRLAEELNLNGTLSGRDAQLLLSDVLGDIAETEAIRQ